MLHYNKHGADATFIEEGVSKQVIVNRKSVMVVKVYAFPKYRLKVGGDEENLKNLIVLTLGSLQEKQDALGHPPYSWTKHRKMRQRNTVVLVTDGALIIDTHEDYIKGGGQTEHSLFVGHLEGMVNLNPPRLGPKRQAKRQRGWRRSGRSAAAKAKIRTPSPQVLWESSGVGT